MLEDHRPSKASAARWSLYLRCLEGWHRDGLQTVASRQLAESLGLRDAQVRKDLLLLGHLGRSGVGYRTDELIQAIRQAMGLNRTWSALMVGAGNLSRALLRYRGFRERGFRVDGIVDIDPKLLGKEIEGLVISPLTLIPKLVKERGIEIGILAVPAEAAQSVADSLVTAGIKGLLNFAPVVLRLPNEVKIVNVDLTIQLEQLAFQIQMGLESEK